MDYSGVQVRTEDGQAYKRFFGGGQAGWDKRGEFQVEFLKSRGLNRSHRLADVGCGPLRAGAHFIKFLDANCYVGVDYNADFIDEARRVVSSNSALQQKNPTLGVIENFEFNGLGVFDFVVLFSVLNHVPSENRAAFFEQIPSLMIAQTRVFITHATWLSSSELPGGLTASYLDGLTGRLDTANWGWPAGESIFPVAEIRADI